MTAGGLKRVLLGTLTQILAWIPLPLLHAAAIPTAGVLRRLPLGKHAIVERNLRACFPELSDESRRRLASDQWIELVRLATELGALSGWSEDRLEAHIHENSGWEQVEAALAKGRGVLVVTGHFGNWEILNLELSRRLDLVTLYRPPDQRWLDEFISRIRCRFGGRVVASGSSSMRHLLRQLKNGGAVAIAADIQPKKGDGVFAPFLGVPALTMTLVHRLSRKTGCEVVFCEALRRARGQGWSFAFRTAPETMRGEDSAQAMTAFNDWLSERVRAAPDQYLWIYKRFSRRPDPGEPRFYPRT
jgi:KDO2-lipid IV(A) lauroyltransferase